jgi:cbb3-type cytochrome oxidase maturation protein
MDEGTIALTIMSLLLFISFLGFLIWGFKSGQFNNIEESKYRIFQTDKKRLDSTDTLTQNQSPGGEKR